MSNLRQAAQQALEALWYYHATEFSKDTHAGKAIAVLQAALAEDALQRLTDVHQEMEAALAEQCPHGVTDGCKECYVAEQEPVAWMDRDGDVYPMPENKNWAPPHTMLYTAPPKRLPLTDREIHDCFQKKNRNMIIQRRLITRAIEAAHGIKGEA